jgi:hypothetical protein
MSHSHRPSRRDIDTLSDFGDRVQSFKSLFSAVDQYQTEQQQRTIDRLLYEHRVLRELITTCRHNWTRAMLLLTETFSQIKTVDAALQRFWDEHKAAEDWFSHMDRSMEKLDFEMAAACITETPQVEHGPCSDTPQRM